MCTIIHIAIIPILLNINFNIFPIFYLLLFLYFIIFYLFNLTCFYDKVEKLIDQIDENTFVLNGKLAIYEVEDVLGIDIE